MTCGFCPHQRSIRCLLPSIRILKNYHCATSWHDRKFIETLFSSLPNFLSICGPFVGSCCCLVCFFNIFYILISETLYQEMPHCSRKPNIDGPTIKIGIPPWEFGVKMLILRATLRTRMRKTYQKKFLIWITHGSNCGCELRCL